MDNGFNDEGVSTAFRDLLMGLLGLFILIIAVLQLWVNDPKQKSDESLRPPGELVISVFWKQGPIDVDLWMSSPKDKKPVGYRNKEGNVWNLLRDDLGDLNDTLPMNFENGFSRGAPPGDYSVLVYCFACTGPVDVTVRIEQAYTTASGSNALEVIFDGTVRLEHDEDWRTVANFTMDRNRKVSNINHVQRNLF